MFVDLSSIGKNSGVFFPKIEGIVENSIQVEVKNCEIIFNSSGKIPITRIIADFNKFGGKEKEGKFLGVNIHHEKRVPIPNNIRNKKLDISFKVINKKEIEIFICCQRLDI